MARQVLPQGPAAHDVHQLHAATDAEHGASLTHRGVEQRQLKSCAFGFDRAELSDGSFAKQRGVDVEIATCEQQAIGGSDQGVDVVDVEAGGHHERQRSFSEQAIGVGLVDDDDIEQRPAFRWSTFEIGRDEDQWLHGARSVGVDDVAEEGSYRRHTVTVPAGVVELEDSMKIVSLSSSLTALLVSLALPACSPSALSVVGTLVGEVVPAAFSGAMAQVDIQGDTAFFGVWSTLADTCGLSGVLMEQINRELSDSDDTITAIEDFFADVPGDFWLMTALAFGFGSNIDGERIVSNSQGLFLCHFTDGPDLSDRPTSSCATVDASSSEARFTAIDRQSFGFTGSLELVQSSNTTGQRIDAGGVEGTGIAPFCPAFDDTMDAFFDDCFDGGSGEGCQAAVNAYGLSHTISR